MEPIMKHAIWLAMIPLAILGTLTPEPRSPYTGPRQSPIAAQAQEVNTFEERWWPGDGSFAPNPLTFEQRWAPVEQAWGRRVKTITITKPPPEPSQEAVAAINTAVPLPELRSRSMVAKPRPIRVADICTKHGMRKVETGRTWRCKK
jgi:hypothetical protein